MALAAFLKASLMLLVNMLMGIATVDVEWVSRAITGLLGMNGYHGSNRRAEGFAEALFSVL